jgi:hypothetical protein
MIALSYEILDYEIFDILSAGAASRVSPRGNSRF